MRNCESLTAAEETRQLFLDLPHRPALNQNGDRFQISAAAAHEADIVNDISFQVKADEQQVFSVL